MINGLHNVCFICNRELDETSIKCTSCTIQICFECESRDDLDDYMCDRCITEEQTKQTIKELQKKNQELTKSVQSLTDENTKLKCDIKEMYDHIQFLKSMVPKIKE